MNIITIIFGNVGPFSKFVTAEVTKETDKAVQLDGKLWLPKKALISAGEDYKLARWFKPDQRQHEILNSLATIASVSR